MKESKAISIVLVALVALVGILAVACGEVAVLEPVDSDSSDEQAEVATVTPEFRISGLEQMPEELLLERLGLSVSEIRLEPLRDTGGFAYTTSDPIELAFNIAEGEDAIRGETVEFPETGRFLVSIRLEPPAHSSDPTGDMQLEGSETSLRGSLNLEGKVRDEIVTPESVDDQNDGNPLPYPFERIKDDGGGDMWTPFTLTSDRVVFYTFSDVELVSGDQILTFNFDMQDWATSAVHPIIDAVERNDYDGVVDVTGDGSESTSGPEALLESGTVSTALD